MESMTKPIGAVFAGGGIVLDEMKPIFKAIDTGFNQSNNTTIETNNCNYRYRI